MTLLQKPTYNACLPALGPRAGDRPLRQLNFGGRSHRGDPGRRKSSFHPRYVRAARRNGLPCVLALHLAYVARGRTRTCPTMPDNYHENL